MNPTFALAAVLLATPPAPNAPKVGEEPIGGYWAPGERPRVAPPDGRWEIGVGAALLSLGAVGAGAAGAGVWATDPARCDRVTRLDASSCRSLHVLSWVRVGYGIGLAAAGAALLGVGLRRRARRRAFDAGRDFAVTGGPLGVRGAIVGLRVRFGPGIARAW
ncbi:MAG: hypothetical protein D6705_16655 [Deltaproteobacteria bacterium]|nr:MAG: hypothetical protein D6705_16655 [Deltaproteobacteria bacterium]